MDFRYLSRLVNVVCERPLIIEGAIKEVRSFDVTLFADPRAQEMYEQTNFYLDLYWLVHFLTDRLGGKEAWRPTHFS